jgi:hypothetical protein
MGLFHSDHSALERQEEQNREDDRIVIGYKLHRLLGEIMDANTVSLELPADLYDKLEELAENEQTTPLEVLNDLITLAHQQRGWLRDLMALRQQIKEEGGLQVGLTKEAVIARLRQTRREIFDAEYAHLY